MVVRAETPPPEALPALATTELCGSSAARATTSPGEAVSPGAVLPGAELPGEAVSPGAELLGAGPSEREGTRVNGATRACGGSGAKTGRWEISS